MGRHRKTRNEKNIKKDETSDEWIVYKKFKHLDKPHIYKRFKTFREAKKYRISLDKKDAWIDELPESKKVKVLKRGKNYITTKSGYSYIYKTKNYMRLFYGKYKSPEDAEKVIYQLILNNWEWEDIPNELKKLRLPSNDPVMKYVPTVNHQGHVLVHRYIHGKNINYGAYPSKKEANKVIAWLEENNWSENLPGELKALQCEIRTPKNYSKTKYGSYSINKHLNGKTIHFGSYSTEEDAKYAVTELRKHNWDKEWYENNREHLNCNPRYNPAHWNQ